MNCQDANEILDNLGVEQIVPLRRHEVDSHIATCADCARAWQAQSILASLPDVAAPDDLEAQCRVVVAARFASGTSAGGRAQRHVLMWGSLAAMAAAAATLILLARPGAQVRPAETAQVLESEASPSSVDVAPDLRAGWPASVGEPDVAGVAAIKTMAAPRITVRVVVPVPPSSEQHYLYAIANDPIAKEVLESLRAALVAELRKVPGLAVVEEDPAQINAASRHYRLRIGPDLMTGLNGLPMRKENNYDIGFDVQELLPGGSVVDLRMPPAGGFRVDPLATCTGPDAVQTMPCDARTTAVFMVHELRRQVFPADASVTRPLQARFQDFSLAPEERFKAFVELFKQQAKAGGKGLLGDANVVNAAVDLAQLTDATHREQLWRAMRGVGDAALIEPLVASLQQDPETARRAAVETLSADFSGNARARLALETAAISDPHPLVRALATRGLSGEEAWQTYVTSSLKDVALPASQRVEALLYALYPPSTISGVPEPSPANYWQILKGLDEAAVRALAEVFPKADQLRKWPGNNLAGNFAGTHGQNPAVIEMLLTVLEHDTRALNRAVAGERLAQTHASVPRVRNALLKAASGDADSLVRDNLQQVMQRDDVRKAMEAAGR